MSSYKNRKTPGVYLTELPAFPPSVVGVETAIPIFIGYTEYAKDSANDKQLYNTAVKITCMADYTSYFGEGYNVKYVVTAGDENDYDFQFSDDAGTPVYYKIKNADTFRFNLYAAMQLFYDNGGGDCFVVSVANYGGQPTDEYTTGVAIDKSLLTAGIAVAKDVVGPTMLVLPDACLLSDADFVTVAKESIDQAETLGDRVAILDLPNCLDPATWTKKGLETLRDKFYTSVTPTGDTLSFGTAYAPALYTSLLEISDVNYENLKGSDGKDDTLKTILTIQCNALYTDESKNAQVTEKINLAFGEDAPKTSEGISELDEYLCNALPILAKIEGILVGKLNVAPPSGIMAGIWTANDQNKGVWNAPANVVLSTVTAPTVALTNKDQEDYNIPLNGKAINILRAFVNRGTVVWGARTLDGNSSDYRYIQVRRTLIYVEQSIKTALQPFVFAPNVGKTWVTVTSMISNFLSGLWEQGGLMGDTASEAFTVQCGLGSTMTGQDILDGYMIVSVSLQMVHPAEFIELTFTQQMQGV